MEEQRFLGTWWLPSTPDKRVGGVLVVDADRRATLELTEELLGEDARSSALHGAADGKLVTLLDVLAVTGGKTVIGQQITVTEMARAQVVLVGVHLHSKDEEVFDGITVEIAHLTQWSGLTGVKRTDHYSEDLKQFKEARFVVTREFPEVVARLGDPPEELSLGITKTFGGPTDSAWARKANISEHVRLTIKSDSPRSYNGFAATVRALQDLVTLAVQRPCAVGRRTLFVEQNDGRRATVELYYREAVGTHVETINAHDVIFRMSDIEFETTMRRWMELRRQIGLPLHVLFGLDYQATGYLENEIFNAASAAEGFHAALSQDTTDISPDLHEAIKAKVQTAFEGAERTWVSSRVGSNRPGLKTRYEELAGLADRDAVERLLTNVEVWARWLKNARNAIGHLNTDELERRVPEDARYRLARITKALLHLVILNQLGISAEHQRRAVQDIFDYSARQFREEVEIELGRR